MKLLGSRYKQIKTLGTTWNYSGDEMISFDRGIADGRRLDPEEVLKLLLILAAVMEQGRRDRRHQHEDRRGAGHKGQSRRDRRHGREDRRGFLSRRWRLNRKSSAHRQRKLYYIFSHSATSLTEGSRKIPVWSFGVSFINRKIFSNKSMLNWSQ